MHGTLLRRHINGLEIYLNRCQFPQITSHGLEDSITDGSVGGLVMLSLFSITQSGIFVTHMHAYDRITCTALYAWTASWKNWIERICQCPWYREVNKKKIITSIMKILNPQRQIILTHLHMMSKPKSEKQKHTHTHVGEKKQNFSSLIRIRR